MGVEAFVDESKARGLLMCVAVLDPSVVTSTRTAMRNLLLPGQRRLHFTHERDSRRGQIITALLALKPAVTIYDATRYDARAERAARDAALTKIVADLAVQDAQRLVIERDEPSARNDRLLLYRQVRAHGIADRLRYDLVAPREEPLLWIADAVAWCWAKNRRWRDRVRPMVRHVHRV
ncbi:MAG: hypothetical protein ACRCTR_07085 [Actinomycetota bacterium]